MNIMELNQSIARLESEHDQLLAELTYVDNLLKSVGFPEGLASVKEVAQELVNDTTEE